jgi:hypothetical protein
VSDEYLTDEQEQYYRYNPRIPVEEYKDRWNRSSPADPPLNREPPGGTRVQLIGVAMQYAPADIQDKWAEVRRFVLDPGNPDRLRAAADAWCPEGKSGGTGSLYSEASRWKRELHESMYELRKRWTDGAADALGSYLEDRVDVACLDAIAENSQKIAIALRAKATAQDDAIKQINRSMDDFVASGIVGAVIGVGSIPVTGSTLSSVVIGLATAAVSAFVMNVFQTAQTYFDFAEACQSALDRLEVEMHSLGEPAGVWPRPWST